MDFDVNSYSERTKTLREKLTEHRSFWRLPFLENLLKSFTPGERLALYALSSTLALSALVLLAALNSAVSVQVPAYGGTITEGEVGPARFINPLLTLSQPDEDLTVLVYSGLMRATPAGSYLPDLASSYEISADGLTYTFRIRDNATFHDGRSVTADDVMFTVQTAQNPAFKSARRADWEGVQVSAPDQHTVVFKLPHAYAPFIDNATMGILPKHIWGAISAEEFPFAPANTHPIGSGPYRVVSVATDNTGSPTRYDLVPFARYALGEPNLAHLTFLFYPNESAMLSAFNAGRIDAISGISSEELSSVKRNDAAMVRVPLPRIFGVFFNQNHAAVLADSSVRQALDAAIDKDALVNTILDGFGVPLSSPIPPQLLGNASPAGPGPLTSPAVASTTATTDRAAAARAILQKGGWKFDSAKNVWTKGKQTLSFTLATADQPELTATANAVADSWRAAGVQVSVQVYALSELNNNVIRPRSYDALLFGEVVGRSLDLFAFWHSSQRNDPGLNLSLYANSKVDSLLASARGTTDQTQREKLYGQFASLLQKDVPAVFLYSPDFVYLVPNSLKGIELGALTTPAERFLNAYQWYTETEYVWSMFTSRNDQIQ